MGCTQQCPFCGTSHRQAGWRRRAHRADVVEKKIKGECRYTGINLDSLLLSTRRRFWRVSFQESVLCLFRSRFDRLLRIYCSVVAIRAYYHFFVLGESS